MSDNATIILSKNIRRHATFINLCLTWIIVGVSSTLLLYAGFQTGPEPPRMLCLVQASLLYGQPGLTSMSTFALVFQVFYVMRAALQEKDPEHHKTSRKWALLIAPYVAFVSFATWTAYVGYGNPQLVSRERRFFYCSVKESTLTNSITAFSLGVLFSTVSLELWIFHIILSHWRVIRANGLGGSTGMDLNLLCRTAAFAFWIVLGIGLSALSIKAPRSAVPDIALATMGSAVVLVFGTQRDILRAWVFWKNSKEDKREACRLRTSPLDRSGSLSSENSMRQKDLSRSSVKSNSSFQCGPRGPERKGKNPVTTRNISQPVLREDLTFMVYGQAV